MRILAGWKAISAYLKRPICSCIRLRNLYGLPVTKPLHGIYVISTEELIDLWICHMIKQGYETKPRGRGQGIRPSQGQKGRLRAFKAFLYNSSYEPGNPDDNK